MSVYEEDQKRIDKLHKSLKDVMKVKVTHNIGHMNSNPARSPHCLEGKQPGF